MDIGLLKVGDIVSRTDYDCIGTVKTIDTEHNRCMVHVKKEGSLLGVSYDCFWSTIYFQKVGEKMDVVIGTGDVVRIKELYDEDITDTNLKVGQLGVVVSGIEEHGTVKVLFEDFDATSYDNVSGNAYVMLREQLEYVDSVYDILERECNNGYIVRING